MASNSKIAPRRFQVGHVVKRIDRNAEGEVQAEFVGTVVAIDTDDHNTPHHRVDVRWANGTKSYRPEDGLEKADKSELHFMSAADVASAMAKLGAMWGLDRPLHNAELGRALRLTGRDVGATVQEWLRPIDKGGRNVTGPVQVAIEMMLAGAMPPDPLDTVIRRR